MKRYWKVKNRIITNTGKYNKKAGKERKIGKKKSDTPRGSLHSVVNVQLLGQLHFDTLRFTCWP